jgi:hypothetical protein
MAWNQIEVRTKCERGKIHHIEVGTYVKVQLSNSMYYIKMDRFSDYKQQQ